MKIKLKKENLELFKQGTVLNFGAEKWYYYPFWIKETAGEDLYEIVSPERLPKDVRDFLLSERNKNPKIPINLTEHK